ncbi:MAG: anhydro-N-acetylmuramic acid kinase [Flavobacteriales bacterium]
METYRVIGIMSGTSIDGIDLALCDFIKNDHSKWSFEIITSTTVEYDLYMKQKLKDAIHFSGFDLMLLHNEIGNLIGKSVNHFISDNKITKKEIDFISSHGHTIFHQPSKNITTQIGNGANISAITKLPVICDFRSIDVALNGQGAPLVPIGDKLLFSEYNYRLNLGGIANISFEDEDKIIAYDICPVNIVLNKLVGSINLHYDNEGKIARSGKLNLPLLKELNELSFYQKKPPKSLGIEWVEKEMFPILNKYEIELNDKLRTFVEHIAIQISNSITGKNKSVLITGGGTYNTFLIDRLKEISSCKIVIPKKQTIEFKEALIFAFLGVLRHRNEVNCLSSVTGATSNNIGGCIYKVF